MTILNERIGATGAVRPVLPEAEVFGVGWPLYKLHAVLVGLLLVPLVLVLGGSGLLAAWLAGGAVLAVWWGERTWSAARCDHRMRERDTSI